MGHVQLDYVAIVYGWSRSGYVSIWQLPTTLLESRQVLLVHLRQSVLHWLLPTKGCIRSWRLYW